MYCTDPEKLKARKPHRCISCGEPVNPGEQYMRWRCYDGGDAGTMKMHSECYDMHKADSDGGPWEFTPYDSPRPKTAKD